MKIKAIILMMLLSSSVFAAPVTTSYIVNDITSPEASYVQLNGGGINFGISAGRINYITSLGYPNAKTILESSSYSLDCTFDGSSTKCNNLVLIDNQIIPYAVGSVNGIIAASYLVAKGVSTPTVGNPYTITESSDGRLHYITMGKKANGTPEFVCATNPQALDNKTLHAMGFYEKELRPGYVYSISWIHRDTLAGTFKRYCFAPTATISNANFVAPLPDPAPVACPPGCVPK